MKSVTSLIAAAFVCLGVILLSPAVRAQAQDAFKDVPSGDPAYKEITDFQKENILIGYPDGFFNGKRILTRYEFAVAIKRAVDHVIVMPQLLRTPENDAGSSIVASTIQLSPDDVQSFKRLVDEFTKDLALLQLNVAQVRLRLVAMSSHIKSAAGSLDASPKIVSDSSRPAFVMPAPPSSLFAATASDFDLDQLNINLLDRNFAGRANFNDDYFRSGAQLEPGADANGNSVNLSLRYAAGHIGLMGGIQYIDPGNESAGGLNTIGVLSNLTNAGGPFLRVNYNLNNRTQFQVGSDLLTGSTNRSYIFGGGLSSGTGTHDFISTLSAGMQYKLWHSTSLTADWEGVYWDLSAASSVLGADTHPFESYINLGTGINLRGNAMLKMGYQIGSYGNLSGFGGLGPSGSGQTYNAFTTQLNVKF